MCVILNRRSIIDGSDIWKHWGLPAVIDLITEGLVAM